MPIDVTYREWRDSVIDSVIAMADELFRLDAEVQCLQSENTRLKLRAADYLRYSDEEKPDETASDFYVDRDVLEQKVYELGCQTLMENSFFGWTTVRRTEDGEFEPFESWRDLSFREAPNWCSKDDLYKLLDMQLREKYMSDIREEQTC